MSKDHGEKAEKLLQEVESAITSTDENEGNNMIQQDQDKTQKYNAQSTLDDRNRPNLRHSLSSALSADTISRRSSFQSSDSRPEQMKINLTTSKEFEDSFAHNFNNISSRLKELEVGDPQDPFVDIGEVDDKEELPTTASKLKMNDDDESLKAQRANNLKTSSDHSNEQEIYEKRKSLRKLMRRLSSGGMSCFSSTSKVSFSSTDLSLSEIRAKLNALEIYLNDEDNESWSESSNDGGEEISDDDSDLDYVETIGKIKGVLDDIKEASGERDIFRRMSSIEGETYEEDKTTNVDDSNILNEQMALDVEKTLRDAGIVTNDLLSAKTKLEEEKRQWIENRRKSRYKEARERNDRQSNNQAVGKESQQPSQGRQHLGTFFKSGIFRPLASSSTTTNSKDVGQNDEKQNDVEHSNNRISDEQALNQILQYSSFPQHKDLNDEKLMMDVSVKEAFLMFLIFRKFSSPSPSYKSIRSIIENVKSQLSYKIKCGDKTSFLELDDVPLPNDVVVNIGDSCIETAAFELENEVDRKESLVGKVIASGVLKSLPVHFQMAFLRILVRLITGETDQTYNDSFSLIPGGSSIIENATVENRGSQSQIAQLSPISKRQVYSKLSSVQSLKSDTWGQHSDLRHLYARNKRRNDISYHCLYSTSRLRCGEKLGSNYIDSILTLIDSLLAGQCDSFISGLLISPLSRLLGLLSSTSVSPRQLQRMFEFTKSKNYDVRANLHVLRALCMATEGSSLASKLKGKASPQNFFCFGRSSGLCKTFYASKGSTKSESGWPFKSTFGMACWFRIEGFSSSHQDGLESDQLLLKVSSGDGTSFEVSFKKLVTSHNADAAHIMFLVRDSDKSRTAGKTELSRSLEVTRFPIVPRVWFHLVIRHRKKNMMGISKDEVTILLDGKPMLTEYMRFPISGTFGDMTSSKNEPIQPIDIKFCSGLDAETGTLYVFNDNVTNDTLQALYKYTSGQVETNDANDDIPGIISTIEQKVNPLPLTPFLEDGNAIMSLKQADVDEIAIPKNRQYSGAYSVKGSKHLVSNTLDLIGDDELHNKIHNPTNGEFSRQSFVSNIHFVWNPTRITDKFILLEAHSGIHTQVDQWNCVTCQMRSCKEVISSLGGVQSLLPVLKALIFPDEIFLTKNNTKEMEKREIGSSIFLSFALVTAFLRDHDINGREWLRCGGTEILEHILIQCKKRYGTKKKTLWTYINLFRRDLNIAEELVSVLVDLREACLFNKTLELKVSSRLLCNVDLWLGGLSDVPGIALHLVLIPTLSCIAYSEPIAVKSVMNTASLLNWIREYTIIFPGTKNTTCFKEDAHDRVLSPPERSHLIEIILGILLSILTVEVNTENLLPIIQFISFNLDNEYEATNTGQTESELTKHEIETRLARFSASEKIVTLFMLLLETRPCIPGLFETLNLILGDTVSWILCCIVHSFDDKMRSNGVRCFTSIYDILLHEEEEEVKPSNKISMFVSKRTVSRVSKTIKSVGTGLGMIQKGFDTSPKSVATSYNLLWHILKCHRNDIGKYSYSALVNLFVHDTMAETEDYSTLNEFFVRNYILHYGYQLNHTLTNTREVSLQSPSIKVRNTFASNAILQLLRFLPSQEQERWLFNLLTLCRVNPNTMDEIVKCTDWQNCLFQVAAETVEELTKYNLQKWKKNHTTEKDEEKELNGNVLARFDLSFQIYSTLLGHTLRASSDSIAPLELASSLQRIHINGQAVFGVLLSHVLNDLMGNGTMNIDPKPLLSEVYNNSVLNKCAHEFFQMEVDQAAKHWKKLRHITTFVVAIVNMNGYSIVDLFDYRNNLSSMIDDNSGGLYGIRLTDRNSSGVLASDVTAETKAVLEKFGSRSTETIQSKQYNRRICTNLSNQILELLDPYIFPESFDGSLMSQQHLTALIRSTESKFGSSQGPLVISLVRLSLVLLCNLEPSSQKFLKCSSMLRCFLQYCFEFMSDIKTEKDKDEHILKMLERLFICIVLQCHRSLSKCAAVLKELEMSSGKYFTVTEQTKHQRRLYRVVEILGDVVLDVYKNANETLQDSLSKDAYKALEFALATKDEWANGVIDKDLSQHARKDSLKSFISCDWVSKFHDNDFIQNNNGEGEIVIPEQLKRTYRRIGGEKTAQDKATVIMKEIAHECEEISDEYNRAFDKPFKQYLEMQREGTDTSSVRSMERDGNTSIRNLSAQYRSSVKNTIRSEMLKSNISTQRYLSIQRKVETSSNSEHWKVANYTDRLHRRILLIPNRNFDDHASASYDLALGLEREKAVKEREERLRNKREEELAKLYKTAKEGIVKDVQRQPSNDEDDEEEDSDSEESKDYSTSSESSVDSDGLSIGPMSDDENHIPGQLITDWDRIEGDDVILEKKEDDMNGSYLWAKEYIWQKGEKFLHYFENVQIVTVQTIITGELVLTSHSIYFRPANDPISVMTKEPVNKIKSISSPLEEGRWRLNRLTDVYERRYMLRTQAIELFFADTHELFINFCGGTNTRDKFVEKLRQCRTPLIKLPRSLNPKVVFKRRFPILTQKWQERSMSNFEYLMQLNLIAGRTFNDVSQYPVFPWIIADYTSNELDLNNPDSFRDLTKPVGALNPDRLLQLLQRYHDLDGLPEEERFLYGSHYSSPGVVLHFLIRQEPFTTMNIELQSNRFDCPDRLFFDLAGCWNSCLNSTSDVKELIPEFFTCPEIFLNTNNFPLGTTQMNVPIHHVKLPPWAHDSPHEFVRLHKLALESEYVSTHIHNWIDLIFGFKQRGIESVKANNVFHLLSYEGSVDLDKITNDLDRIAAESQIQNFGQTPSQIITTPHPSRNSFEKCWKPIISELSLTKRLTCYTPFRQFGGSRNANTHGPAISIQLLSDYVVVVYADLSVGSYKWSPSRSGKTPFYLKMDKIRPIASREMSRSKFALGVHTGSTVNLKKAHEGNLGIGNWSFAMTKGKVESKASAKDPLLSNYLGATLLSCGYCDDSLKAHSLDGLRLKCSKTGGHSGPINCMQLSEDGILLITGGDDATCRIWTVESPETGDALIDSFVKTAQDESPDESLLCCRVLWGHGSPITCLAFDNDLDVVVSGSIDGKICVHTVRCSQFVRSIEVSDFFPPEAIPTKEQSEKVGLRKVAIHKDGTFVAHLENGMLQMYSINGVKLGCIDAGERLSAMEIIPSVDSGSLLVTGGESGHVIVRSLQNLEIKYVLDLSDYGPIFSLAFSPISSGRQQFMFVGTADGSLTVACSHQDDDISDEIIAEDAAAAQYTQHQVEKKETKSWWRQNFV